MRHGAIDLSAFLPPDAIEPLDYEAALADRKAAFLRSFEATGATPAELEDMRQILSYEYEPIVGLLEADAFEDLRFVARGNDKVRAVLLATATGNMLDHLAATPPYRVMRRVITPANAATGALAVLEDDETFRQRIALSPESWSCAGPEGAYLYFGLASSGDVLDIACYSWDEGVCDPAEVRVVVLARDAQVASAALLATVSSALNREEVRPIADKVVVVTATPLPYTIDLTLQVAPGASPALVSEAARKSIGTYVSGRRRWVGDGQIGPVDLIGRRIRLTTIAAAARVSNVEEVIVNMPMADINVPVPGDTQHLFRAPICTAINIAVEVVTAGWAS